MLNNYEMMIALKPLLPDDVRKALHKEIVDMVSGLGGEVVDVDVWGKRYLAYNIRGHNEAYYIVYNFKLPSDQVTEIKRQFELKQEFLRYVIVEVEHPELIGKSIKKKEIDVEV
ncbi:30S ribosomal protein S6 [bacterium]|nr:30S ribosomal protein S6 [bacterium]